MGLLLIWICINDLPNVTVNTNLSDNPKTLLFMDNISVVGNGPSFTDTENIIHMVLKTMNKWFSSNLLSLSFGKTHSMQLVTKYSSHSVININYNK